MSFRREGGACLSSTVRKKSQVKKLCVRRCKHKKCSVLCCKVIDEKMCEF